MLQTEKTARLQHFFAPRGGGRRRRLHQAGQGRARHPAQPASRAGFKGDIYPINPTAPEVLGVSAYASVKDVAGRHRPGRDRGPRGLAVPGVIEECGDKGIDAAIVISAGFKEAGAGGRGSGRSSWRRWRSRRGDPRGGPQLPRHHRHRPRPGRLLRPHLPQRGQHRADVAVRARWPPPSSTGRCSRASASASS